MPARLAPFLIIALLLTGAAALAGILAMGYDHWLAIANAASAKGSAANYLTPEVWSAIRRKAQIAIGLLIILAGLACWKRGSITHFCLILGRDARGAIQDISLWLRQAVAEDGPWLWAAAGLLSLGGLWLRWRDLDQPLRHDEALVFLNFVRRPLLILVAMYNDVANHVFETVLKHVSWQLFGSAEWAIRLPVFIAGSLLPPLLFLLVRAMYGALPALIAAALAAGSSALLEYSVNARGYEFLAFWSVLLLGLRHLLAKRDNLFLWLAWALISALDFWTNPSAILSYGVVATWLLLGILGRPREQRLPGLMRLLAMSGLGAGLTVLFYSPILISSGIGHMSTMLARGGSDLSLGSPAQRLQELAATFTRNQPSWLAMLLGLAGLAGLLLEPWQNRRRAPFVLALLIWLGLFLTLFPTFGFVRLWLPYAIFSYVMIGAGTGFALNRIGPAGQPIGIALALGLGLAGILGEVRTDSVRNNPDGSFFEARTMALDMRTRLKPGDLVLAPCPGTMPLLYEMEKLGLKTRIVTVTGTAADGTDIVTQAFSLAEAPEPTYHGAYYLIQTDNIDPSELTRLRRLPQLFPSSEAASILPGLTHTKVYQLPMPAGLTLQ